MSVGLQRVVQVNPMSVVVPVVDGAAATTTKRGSAPLEPPFGFGAAQGDMPSQPTRQDEAASKRSSWGRHRTRTVTNAARHRANIGWTALIWINEWPCDSIYALAVGVNLLHNTQQTKMSKESLTSHWRGVFFENALVYFPYWLLMLGNVAAQSAIIWFIRDIVIATDGQCNKTSYILQLICAMVYSAQIWVDLWQTFKMWLYLRWIPTLRSGLTWRLGITQVLLDENWEVVDFCRDNPELPKDQCEGHGIYPRTRYLLYLFVILPKFAIGMFLWWYGLYFLVVSETDTDLLLNAVALLFVLDIDELIGELVPESTRLQVARFPVYKLTAEDFFAEFTPSEADPSKNVLGTTLRDKNRQCAWANLRDPIFFWSTYGHQVPPVVMALGVLLGSEIMCRSSYDE